MPKKYPPGYIKDEKKVLAGKARAQKSLRVEGRFISTKFEEGLKKDMEQLGIPLSQAQRYLQQNENTYKELYLNEQLSIENNFEQLRHNINTTENTIFFNGRKVKKITALKYIAELKRYLGTEYDYWNFRVRFSTTLAGRLTISLPRPGELDKLDLTDEEIQEYLEDDYGIEIEDGTDPKVKRERKKLLRQELKERQCKFILNAHGKRCKNIAMPDEIYCYIHLKINAKK